jgi:aspartyl-tRNA(Asn)/glutamyl-tRNA(Gln) amidotransferase subunit A
MTGDVLAAQATAGAEELADLSAGALAEHFRSRALSPVEVLEAVHRRIERLEPVLHALWAADPAAAVEAARRSEQRWRRGEPAGPVDGVPVTVKENLASRGVPVPLGTAATPLVPAAEDSPPVARLREAGAVLLAKTTMPDYGMLSSGLSSFHALARNPWNPAWTPGGSSAGAAAAAAAGYGPLHVGTDIGGSVRLPASWTATTTLKPSLGRVPLSAPWHSRVAGPMTRTVADSALLLSVLAQPDWRDHMSLPPASLDWTSLDSDVRGLRVGLWLEPGAGLPVDPQTRALVEAAARTFADAGAEVEVLPPFADEQMLADLDLFWRVRAWTDFSRLPHERQAAVLPYIADWCRGGADVPGTAVMRCVNRLVEIRAATVTATQPFDLVLSPVSPVPTFPAEWPSPTRDPARALEHIGFTFPFSISEQPAASVNCGFDSAGKSVGLQIAARRFDDLGALRAAAWYERARPASARPDWTALSRRLGSAPDIGAPGG